jgi:YVTN family beta-propeller protein
MTRSCERAVSRLRCREEAFLGTAALFVVCALIFFIGRHPIPAAAAVRYLSPVALQQSPNGQRLYVVCEDSDAVLAVDTLTRQVIGRADVGKRPKGIAISSDGKTIYVSDEASDAVTQLDAQTLKIERTLAAGWGPVGLVTDRAGTTLYVANTLGNDLSSRVHRFLARRQPSLRGEPARAPWTARSTFRVGAHCN